MTLTTLVLGGTGTPDGGLRLVSSAPSGAAPSPGRQVPLGHRGNRVTPGDQRSATIDPGVYSDWAAVVAASSAVPARALSAYAAAAAQVAIEQPDCHLNWTTLAGIGYVESLNGADGGGLGPEGRPLTPIIGVPLTGVGDLADVPDSDGGVLDGDTSIDRAVGPMQFLPSTWRLWGTDADGNGLRDPQDIDDASLATARYLCVSGDLSTASGWTAAVLSYNHSTEYVAAVYAAATQIASLS